MTLTFELVTPISIGLIHMLSIKQISQIVDELLIGNDFHTYCDLDLWPNDHNFNRDHLLSKANAHGKYQRNRWMGWQVIDLKQFHTYCDSDLDLVTTIYNRDHLHVLSMAFTHGKY